MKYYFFAQDEIEHGPFTLDELKEKRLKKSTLVWNEGMSEWAIADSLEELRHILITEPPPLPKSVAKTPSPVNESIDKPEILEIQEKEHTSAKNKYDPNYALETEATVVGAIALIVLIIVNIPGVIEFEASGAYSIFIIVLLIFRILTTIWVFRIAARQNRNITGWGWFAFLLPSLALIVIGTRRKLCKDEKYKLAKTTTGKGFFTYDTDNNEHNYVSDGKFSRLTQNLDVTKFQNGDLIPEIQSPEEWIKACDERLPACCYFNNDEENGKIFGRLYNWYAVNDPRGLAPNGYRVPTDKEWNQLASIDQSEIAKLNLYLYKAFEFDKIQNIDKKKSFLPFGYRLGNNGLFINQRGIIRIYYWSSSEVGNWSAWHSYVESTSSAMFRSMSDKGNGYYVRCLKD